jgi:hypothetical protein
MSGLGIMTARIVKPAIIKSVEYPSIRKREKPKRPEKSNTESSQFSKKDMPVMVPPLKLPGLSGSTQGSTQNEIKKTNKNDKVYNKSEIQKYQ